MIKFGAFLFAALAAIPQALKWMVFGFMKMNGCDPAARECMIRDNDQGAVMHMIYDPNIYNTTGLWVGLAGLAVMTVIGMVASKIDAARSRGVINRADRESGLGREPKRYGGTARPGYLNKVDRRRE
jgi:hypothetical protein